LEANIADISQELCQLPRAADIADHIAQKIEAEVRGILVPHDVSVVDRTQKLEAEMPSSTLLAGQQRQLTDDIQRLNSRQEGVEASISNVARAVDGLQRSFMQMIDCTSRPSDPSVEVANIADTTHEVGNVASYKKTHSKICIRTIHSFQSDSEIPTNIPGYMVLR